MATMLELSRPLADALKQRTIVDPPKVGIHENVPMAVYHAWEAASNSRLTKIQRSPAHLKAYLDQPAEDTLALKIGRAVHTAILEPDSFDAMFSVATTCEAIKKGDHKRCANDGKYFHHEMGWLCGVHAKGFGPFDESRIALSASDYAVCIGARDSVYAHGSARPLLRGLEHVELSAVWIDKETGILCKARFDGYTSKIDGGIVADVKSTKDASPNAFERSAYALGYHRQGGFYLDGGAACGLPVQHFLNIAVEKEPPFAAVVYRYTEGASGALDAGREQLRHLKRTYAKCIETNTWPAYSQDVVDLTLPNYAWKQIDDEITQFGHEYEVTP